jgi:hypothetical protein
MRLTVRAAAFAARVALGLVCFACSPAVPSPSAVPSASGPVDPDAAAHAMLTGPWQPAPVLVDENLLFSIAYVCRNAGDPAVVAALADVPVAVVDARGGALASVILADDNIAYECRLKFEMVGDGLGATIIDGPSRLEPGAIVPVEDDGIRVVSHTRVDEESGARTLLIGRVGPDASSVSVAFNDETEVTASKDNGWFLAWWPDSRQPSGIAALDTKNVVVDTVPSPTTEVEGRVGPAAWWIDPAAIPLSPKATKIPGLIREQGCASGRSPEGRVLDPAIFSADDAMLVTFWVRRPSGNQECPRNPDFPVEITLPEPLGDRKLLDGSAIPPRDATVPAD